MSDIFRDYSFGGWLREFRVSQGLTLREASEVIGMDPGNYSKLERSLLDPPTTSERVREIGKALNLHARQIEFLESTAFSFHVGKFKERWFNQDTQQDSREQEKG